jgi:hypothetical protein
MKMYTAVITIIILFAVTIAHAGSKHRGTSEALRVPGTPVIQVFDNVSTVGAIFKIPLGFLPDQSTMQVVVNGSPSAWEIVLEGTIVGENGPFVAALTLPDSNGLPAGHYALKPWTHLQARLVSKTGGGSFDVYVITRGN